VNVAVSDRVKEAYFFEDLKRLAKKGAKMSSVTGMMAKASVKPDEDPAVKHLATSWQGKQNIKVRRTEIPERVLSTTRYPPLRHYAYFECHLELVPDVLKDGRGCRANIVRLNITGDRSAETKGHRSGT
jgi:hypothetical protein